MKSPQEQYERVVWFLYATAVILAASGLCAYGATQTASKATSDVLFGITGATLMWFCRLLVATVRRFALMLHATLREDDERHSRTRNFASPNV